MEYNPQFEALPGGVGDIPWLMTTGMGIGLTDINLENLELLLKFCLQF